MKFVALKFAGDFAHMRLVFFARSDQFLGEGTTGGIKIDPFAAAINGITGFAAGRLEGAGPGVILEALGGVEMVIFDHRRAGFVDQITGEALGAGCQRGWQGDVEHEA